MELILCRVVASFCSPSLNTVPHIPWHDLPYHMTTKKSKRFSDHGNFSVATAEILDSTWLCDCQQYLYLFHTVVEYIPSIHDQRKMLVLSNQLLYWVLSAPDQCFASFQPIFMSSTYTDKSNPFSRCTKRHSQFGIFSQPCFNRSFSNCLSHNRPAKG